MGRLLEFGKLALEKRRSTVAKSFEYLQSLSDNILGSVSFSLLPPQICYPHTIAL